MLESDDPPPDERISYLADSLERRLVSEGLIEGERNRVVIGDKRFAPSQVVDYVTAAPLLGGNVMWLYSFAKRNGLSSSGGLSAANALAVKLMPETKATERYKLEAMAEMYGVSLAEINRFDDSGLFEPRNRKKRDPAAKKNRQRDVFLEVLAEVVNRMKLHRKDFRGEIDHSLIFSDLKLYLGQCIERRIADRHLYDIWDNTVKLPIGDYSLDSHVEFNEIAGLFGLSSRKVVDGWKDKGNLLIRESNGAGIIAGDVLCLYLFGLPYKRRYAFNEIGKLFGIDLKDASYVANKSGIRGSRDNREILVVKKLFRDSYDLAADAFRKGDSLLNEVKVFSRSEAEEYVDIRLLDVGVNQVGIESCKFSLFSCKIVDITRSDLSSGRIVYREGYDQHYLDKVVDRYINRRRRLREDFRLVPREKKMAS